MVLKQLDNNYPRYSSEELKFKNSSRQKVVDHLAFFRIFKRKLQLYTANNDFFPDFA
jgi:hypothetical protein